MLNRSIWPIIQSCAITPGQSGQGAIGNEDVFHVPQCYLIGALTFDVLMSYSGYKLGESYPSAEMQSVYSSTPADWAAF